MGRFIVDESASQLFVDGSLDSLLPQSSVARTIWGCLSKLDFSDFEAVYRNDTGGRPAIDPRRLTAVWILALVRGQTSSVELARRCGEDIELRWLLGDARVEKSTLCAFRTLHVERLRNLSTRLLASLARAGLLPGEELAVDGSVVRAAASCKASLPRKKLRRRVAKLGDAIETMLLDDSAADARAELAQRKERFERALAEMDALGLMGEDDRLTVTEPDASKKKLKNGCYAPAHNVQVVTDMSSGAILHTEVIAQGNDCGQLEPQLENGRSEIARVRALLEEDAAAPCASPAAVCADAAYHDTRQLVRLSEQGIKAVVPNDQQQNRRPPGVSSAYLAEAFEYDEQNDEMICPQNKRMQPRKLNANQTAMTYQANALDCQHCPAKDQCCPKAKHGRSVNRPLYSEVLAEVSAHVSSREGQRCMRERKIAGEGAFARMLHLLTWPRCRTWGTPGAQAEALWRQITHNLLLLTGHWRPITG